MTACISCRYWRRARRLNYGHCFAPTPPFWLAEQALLAERHGYSMPPLGQCWTLTHPSMGAACAAHAGARPEFGA